MSKEDRWCLATDDEGHWYHIPRSQEDEFYQLLEDDPEGEFYNKFEAFRTRGGWSHIDCYPPKGSD